MRNGGKILLNGQWISADDLHRNAMMKARRDNRFYCVLSAIVTVAMIVFAVVIAK